MTATPSPPQKRLIDVLQARGIIPTEVPWHIRQVLLPRRARFIETFFLLFGGSPRGPEWECVKDLAHCASTRDVEDALADYRANPLRGSAFVSFVLGFRISRRHAREYFRRTMAAQGLREARGK